MTAESRSILSKAPIPGLTYTLGVKEHIARGKALRNVASRKA